MRITKFLNITIAIALLSATGFCQKSTITGTVVAIKFNIISPVTHKVMDGLPDDSVFVYNNQAIEIAQGLNDTEIFGNFQRKPFLAAVYFIDFKKMLFTQLQDKEKILPKGTPLKPLKDKKYGYEFLIDDYKNEKYSASDTIINHTPCKVIVYTSSLSEPTKKGVEFRLLINKTIGKNNDISLFPAIEDKFGGRLLEIQATYPNNAGTWVISVERKYNVSSPYFAKIAKLTTLYNSR